MINQQKELTAEEQAEKLQFAREIVREVQSAGINEDQKLFIIYNLALSIENFDDMCAVVDPIKETMKKRRVLLIHRSEDENEED